MPQRLDGQCQCGEVQYQVTGTPITVFACHCTECQRQSSSAFGMALWVKNAEVTLLRGEIRHWVRAMPSGRNMKCSFCPNCGTRLFHQVLGQSEMISIKPGTLNDTTWLRPAGHIWTKSAQSWVLWGPTDLLYEENPDNFSDLISAWMEANHA
jgi:hypothetical protein